MALRWKKRCFRCLQYLRNDGTCQNPKCVRYVNESNTEEKAETKASETVASTNASSTATEGKA